MDTPNSNHSGLPFSAANYEPYLYQPLESAKYETFQDKIRAPAWKILRPEPRIRVLHLLPGTKSALLQCFLEVVEPFLTPSEQLSNTSSKTVECLSYEAVSYAWGDGTLKEDILCSGKRLQITHSLATVLRSVRHVDRTRVLWADGICINQEDVMERGHQVLLMAAIYSRAEQVLCCLGDDEGGHAEYTFNLARKLSSKVGHLLDATFPKIHANISTGATAYIDLSWHFLANFDGLDHELGSLSGSEHFVELFRKPWFSRMWIRQEIGWAAKAMLRCGNSEIDWTSIVWLHFWATARSYWIGSTAKWTQAMPVVSDDFLDPSKSLLELLFASREFQCTDPRDKVFALLAHPSAYRDMALGSFEDYTAEVIQAKARGEDEHAVSKKLSEAFSNLTKYLISVLHEHFPQLKDIDSWETSEGQQDRARIEEVENVRINLLNIRDWMQGEIHKIESSSTRDLNLETDVMEEDEISISLERSSNISQEDGGDGRDDGHNHHENHGGDVDLMPHGLINRDLFSKGVYILDQGRRLAEISNLQHHPMTRMTSSSVFTCFSSRRVIEPDYTRSVDDIYCEVARSIIEDSKTLNILYAVQHNTERVALEDTIPSWVPRWDCPKLHVSLGMTNLPSAFFSPWITPESYELRGSVEGNILMTPAVPVDAISFTIDPISRSPKADERANLMRFWKSVISCDTKSRHMTSLQRVQMYQRTITANNIMTELLPLVWTDFNREQLWDDFAAFWVDLYNEDQACTDNLTPPMIPHVPELQQAACRGNGDKFLEWAYCISRNRRIFGTEKGYLGLGPKILQEGDVVYILPSYLPFVLRPRESYFLLVGECYVDGIMNGEEMDACKIVDIKIH